MNMKNDSKKSVTYRELIRANLVAENWEDVSLESTTDIEGYLDIIYANSTMTLELEYEPKKKRIYLAIYEIMGQGVDLILDHKKSPLALIKKIISFQDDISTDNYKDKIEELFKICPDICVDIDGKLYQLIK